MVRRIVAARLAPILTAFLLSPSVALADTMHIDQGYIGLGGDGNLVFSFGNANFGIQRDLAPFPWMPTGLTAGCAVGSGCVPGQSFNFGNETDGSVWLGTGVAVTNEIGMHANSVFSGHWRFIAPEVRVPSSGEEFVTLTAPFAFRSAFGAALDTGRVLPVNRIGNGTATIPLQLVDGRYVFQPDGMLRYKFSNDPIPEPASLLMIGTGVAALSLRRRVGGPTE